eukprot:m.94510 g.94510  ORF g.94510 m.94510 type:complete len:117 (+) comp51252_c0_seq1:50-400(+)
MVVALRLAVGGLKRAPLFRIVAAHNRCKRDGKHLELLGTYDPIPSADKTKFVSLNFQRTKYWLSVGAQPSEPVARLLGMAGILPAAVRRTAVETAVPRADRRAHRQATKAAKLASK